MIRFRPARTEDAAGIARVYVEGWRDAYPGLLPDKVLLGLSVERQEAAWRESVKNDRGRGMVQVATDGRVVGFGSAGRTRFPALPFAGEVFTLYVDGDRRDQGIGRALLASLFGALAKAGIGSAVVWVLAGNPARHFYTARGGKLVAAWTEQQWGVPVPQAAFGWPDLARVAPTKARDAPPS